MSILRERYNSIPDEVFQLDDAKTLFKHYLAEFIGADASETDFVAMFLNIIRDFIDNKISENMLSGLIHTSLFDDQTKKYHYEPHLWSINDVLALLHELLDITWTKDSPDYPNYLAELKKKHLILTKKYQG